MHIGTVVKSDDGAIQVGILIGDARQPLYRHNGRTYVAARPGQSYSFVVDNSTGGRLEVITTVDGRNTLKNEPGDSQANHGLVIGPFDRYNFVGWRLDDFRVGEFVFGDPASSVAALTTDDTSNVGVIGIAAYRERAMTVYRDRGNLGGPVYKGGGATRGGSVGTGMGAIQSNYVGATAFYRSGDPVIMAVYYDTEEVLRARGIIAPAGPNPFPGADTGYGRLTEL